MTSSGVLTVAKVQWKIDILKLKAKITDNLILKDSLTFYIISNRIQKLSKLSPNEFISQSEGSDIFEITTNDPKFIKIEIENNEMIEEVKKIENKHKRKTVQIDESNQDLMQANQLLAASNKL